MCSWRDELGVLLLGLVTGAEAQRIADHVMCCPACWREVSELLPVVTALAGIAADELSLEVEPPPGFEQRVLEAVRRQHPAPATGGPPRRCRRHRHRPR